MTKDILLVSISSKIDMKMAPLALLYIGGALKKEGYTVKIFHLNSVNLDKAAKDLISYDPLYIGFSVITGSQTRDSAKISKKLKELNPNIKILWGGIHPSLLPLQCISEDYIDYVICGEGEKTVVEFTNALLNEKRLDNIPGLVFKKEGKIFVNSARDFIKDLDNFMPDWSLIDLDNHLDKMWDSKRVLSYTTSRGCPFNCRFCYNQIFNKSGWRPFSEKKVVEDILKLKDVYGIDGIQFFDDLLFANPTRATSILQKIKLPWHGELRTNFINEKLVDTLIDTDAREILFGFESGSDRMLKRMNKMQTVADIRKSMQILSRSKNYKIIGTFILGMPYETKDEMFKTIDLGLELSDVENFRANFGVYLPFPGSEMYNEAVELGFVPPQRTEDWDILDRWSNKLNLSWITWNNDPDYFRRIRQYFAFLPIERLAVPIIKDIPRQRLLKKDFSHKFEIYTFSKIQPYFANRQSLFRKSVRSILPYLKR